ncbi:Glyoxalase-like domain protein [Thalassoglobus neptunius]|uniref:Glyoxalase-like domain protein n=1 Tax=Thalassoglobus neptunius TaxID=1938619 RepID=A0A5C5X733_9PLAN|nr:VOC family protein [Thalassoglobus neptunius]TWT57832.1 Glyoxalase-like domain protein [Thalassoglobus neptunius]
MGNMNREKNRAVWFDLPVEDLDRAAEFYRHVLAVGVDIEEFNGTRFGVIEHEDGNGGCLVIRSEEITATKGVLIYLNVHGRINDAIECVNNYGGEVIEEVHSIGPHGLRAIILDTEGNRIALHSDHVDDA